MRHGGHLGSKKNYIICLKEVWVNASFCKAIKEVLKNIFNTILGLFVLAGALSLFSNCPTLYRGLTKWANQPPIPLFKSCIFTPMAVPDLQNLPTLKGVKKYKLTFETDNQLGDNTYAIVYTDDFRFSLYSNDSTLPPMTQSQHLFFTKRSFAHSPEIIVWFDGSETELEKEKFDAGDCPIKIEFFGGSK